MKPPLLVTGAAGFVGARWVESCNRRGQRVISCDEPQYFTQRQEHQGLEWGQIVDRAALLEWLKSTQPALRGIVHLGACTDTTELDEAYLTEVNLQYSQSLWRYATQAAVPFVYASSAATYGNGKLGYSDEENRLSQLKPLNPYGDSKQRFDLWALEQEKKDLHPPQWSGFKFFNVYGFGERHKEKMASVVLHAYDQIQTTGRVKLFKSYRSEIPHGLQKRDFIYVEDVLAALWFALEKPIPRGIYNLGTGKARSFLDLAHAVFAACGRPPQIDFIEMPETLRDRYQYFTEAELGRLRSTGFAQEMTSLEAGTRQYIERLRD